MQNQYHIFETLHHRLEIFHTLAQDPEKHAYLLPELLLKTIRDTHRVFNQGISHINCVEILESFHIDLSQEESSLLSELETSLRKAKEYQELSATYNKNTLIKIAAKVQLLLRSQTTRA